VAGSHPLRERRSALPEQDLQRCIGTPTFFVNGRRHYGSYDIHALTSAVATAKKRAAISAQLCGARSDPAEP